MGKNKTKIILLLALALVLRLINLNQSFWLDEGAQVLMSQKSLTFIWFGRGADFQPPLFYFLIHFWLKLGRSEIFLRLPSVFFGITTIYLVYLLAKRLFDEKVGLLSALFLAFAPYHIYYSQEVRMYSLLAFLGTLSTYFLWRKKYLFYLLTTTVSLYTHYFAFLILIFHLNWIISGITYFSAVAGKYARLKTALRRWVLVFGGIFLLFSPWIPQFVKQLQAGKYLVNVLPGWRQVSNLSAIKAFPLTLIKFSLGRISFDNKIFYTGIAIFIFTVLGFIFYQASKKLSKEKIFLINWFLVPVLLCILISFFIPMYQPFRLLFTIIPFYLLIAIGALSLNKRYQSVAIGAILLISFSGLFLYYTNPKFQREDWRAATKLVESQDPQNSVAIFEFSEPFAPYLWYSQGKMKAYGVLPGLRATPEVVNQKMPEVTKNVKNIFLFQYLQPLTDPERLVEGWLQKNGFEEKEIKDFSGVGFVYNYIRR